MCDERLAAISERAEEIGAEFARLKLEEEFLKKMKGLLQEMSELTDSSKSSEDMSETRRKINIMPQDDDLKLSEPNRKLLNIIRETPGISTQDISKRVEVNGQSLSNRLGDLQRRDLIGNGGTKRPGGARWFVK